MAEQDREQERLATTVAQLESGIARAAAGIPIGRSGRVRQALGAYFQAARAFYEGQLRQAEYRAQLRIWTELEGQIAHLSTVTCNLRHRLEAIAPQLEAAAAEQLARLQAGGVSRLSLADEAYVRSLYRRFAPAQVNLMALGEAAAEAGGGEPLAPLDLAALSTNALAGYLLAALEQPFTPIVQMTVESVIGERAGEVTPRARRQQLFRLATPSWSIDRARLPEGGAELVRLEVMGVPDERVSHFTDETMLVSTRDPYRLVALVVVAGAPQSALQQYSLYQQALDRVRGQRPVHVHPHFLVDNNEAQLAFALGSIFGLVNNQGTYFYYQPSDPLQSPVRLGNGLTNAVGNLVRQEVLAQEILQRVDGQIAQMGLQRAIDKLTAYYTTAVPDGRTRLDETMRELKRLVRAYTDELRQIRDLNPGREE